MQDELNRTTHILRHSGYAMPEKEIVPAFVHCGIRGKNGEGSRKMKTRCSRCSGKRLERREIRSFRLQGPCAERGRISSGGGGGRNKKKALGGIEGVDETADIILGILFTHGGLKIAQHKVRRSGRHEL